MRPNPNYHTLGVEFELTSDDVRADVALTDDQLESFKEWLRPRWKAYGWTEDDVTHHAAIDSRKIDLSPLNWSLVLEAVREIGGGSADTLYLVQIGAFRSKDRAEAHADKARLAGFSAIVKKEEK